MSLTAWPASSAPATPTPSVAAQSPLRLRWDLKNSPCHLTRLSLSALPSLCRMGCINSTVGVPC